MFRIYNKKLKKYEDSSNFAVMGDGDLIQICDIAGREEEGFEFVDQNIYKIEKCSMMKFNDKYLYQGDIISFYDGVVTPILSGEVADIEHTDVHNINYKKKINYASINFLDGDFYLGSKNIEKYYGYLSDNLDGILNTFGNINQDSIPG